MPSAFHALRKVSTGLALAAVFAISPVAHAHHGWQWAKDEHHTLSGTVVEAKLGNPHGIVTLEVGGERWTVEVGQPWRNARAGLADEMLAPGASLSAVGPRSAREGERVLKAERITIDGKHYDLYPERLR